MVTWPAKSALQLSARAALSAGIAVAVAELFRLEFPIYALVGAVIVSDLSPATTRQLGRARLSGSVVGAVVGAAISQFLPQAPWAIALSILVAMFLSSLLHLRGAAKIAGYVCGIVVLSYTAEPWSYALYRLIETVLGIGVALLVSFIPPLGHSTKGSNNE